MSLNHLKKAVDTGTATEKVTITVFQSAGLVSHTRLLAEMTREVDATKVTALVTATILLAAAALEALLLEAAHELQPDLYGQNDYRRTGAPNKFERLVGYKSPEVQLIWDVRNAIAHSEPPKSRSRDAAQKLSMDSRGANLVIEILERVANEVWGESMPSWFKEGACLP